MMEALKRVFEGAFKPRNTMAPRPPATPITHDRNRIETPRPARDQSEESQKPPTRDGDQYSTGVFALISTGGRKSLDSGTERDSPTATRKSSQPAVHEFRSVHQKNGCSGKGRPRRQPGQSQQSSYVPKSSPKLPSTPARNYRRVEDIEDEEEDVLLLPEQLPKPKPKHGAIRSSEQVDLTGEDQDHRQELKITIPAIPADRLGRKRAKADSPDELNDDVYMPGRANKRSKGMPGPAPRAGKSSSLSSKGDIGSTFSPRRGTGPITSGRDLPQFRLKAAVCPPRSICDDAQVLVPRQSDPRMLDPRQPGGQDAPLDNRTQDALPYEWLHVRLTTMNRLFYSPGHQYITIERPSLKDFGGKLFLKFLDQEDGRNFVAWAEQQIGDKAKLVIQEATNTEKQFDNARGHVENFARSQAEKRAETRRSKEQTTHNAKADRLGPIDNDVILTALNRRREGAKTGVLLGGPEPTQPPSARKRLRESMADDVVVINGPEPAQPSSAKKRLRQSMADDVVAIGGDAEVREVKRPNIERRSTRSAPASSVVVAVNSPRVESSPPPRAWTLEHPGWDREWRLPLTYHRTIIHKEDVARLDDGEFLNDSIISFYLNYLHNRLKATDKDTAARFYFHNSFFYERLKPAKGKSINYDNVKSWTSRVDIFKYDFIVVPVNEHSHWWVAVICNPGKLIPDEPALIPEVCPRKSVADEPGAGARDDSEDAERSSNGPGPEVPKKVLQRLLHTVISRYVASHRQRSGENGEHVLEPERCSDSRQAGTNPDRRRA
ncbi:Ulp1 protease [Magnaporthiopsis poae ATCC 64411]|uniref:Ulp1 protease n=1 Tax=Magnaporthiopsis poae (strain ATCC 64411 / 73-15) TaxID=644358 RepID=A0A0C4DZ57_MAGP6|nr:Ulp1 protease [Magnaporthiopsis poae ATCC 64411]